MYPYYTPRRRESVVDTAHQSDVLTPYVPEVVIAWLTDAPDATHRTFDGTMAFVDISGFTRLSERLARRGKVGAEEISETIGTCFSRLMAVAQAEGGSLIKFGGDALLLFFAGPNHAARACRAAVGMRRTLREIGRQRALGAGIALRMSVGIHSGAFHFFLVGDSHRELIVTGPAATETVTMEATAQAGDVVVSRATAAGLPESVIGAAADSGFLLSREPVPAGARPPPTDVAVDRVDLLRCIPVAVRDHLLSGGVDAEHRKVTVAFLRFGGTDQLLTDRGPDETALWLDELMRTVQRAVDRRGITFLGSDVDRDGGKLILAAGAPISAGEDAARILLALREIIDARSRLTVRVGVNRGSVFAGDVGPPGRRTYTVMGDEVNLAARVMGTASPGQILATGPVLEASGTAFRSHALEPFKVKGKAKPIQAFDIGAASGGGKQVGGDAEAILIGRELELRTLFDALGAARAGKGTVVEILGEPGIGKSRLVQELRIHADDTLVLSATCELYESSTPYFPFRALLRGALGIAEGDDDERAVERLTEGVSAIAADLLPLLPLIALPVGLELPPTPATEQLEDRFLRPRLQEAVGVVLSRLLTSPSLITIEDGHWMDEASSDLLTHLCGLLPERPWLVCVTRREQETGFVAPAGPDTTTVRPAPLGPGQASALLASLGEDAVLPPHRLTALAERSGGNPLFLMELLRAAGSAGALEELPDSIEAVIMSRIDRLAPPDRGLLRRASVLGLTFPEHLLPAVLDDASPSSEDPVWTRLGEFLTRDGDVVGFTHMLVRDGAYEGLPYRLRRELHARAGERIESTAGDDPEAEAELLSLHFFNAHRLEEAWRYSLVAGDRARSIYANVDAARFYERALESARRVPSLPPEGVARVLERLGDVRRPIGEYAMAKVAYRSARRLIPDDGLWRSRLLLKVARIEELSGRYAQAIRQLRQASRLIEGSGDPDAARQRAQVAVSFAGVRQAQGRHGEATDSLQQAIAEAEAAGDRDALGHALYLLDWVYVTMGRLELATHSERALAIFEELGDVGKQGSVLNNLGGFAYLRGRWDDALDLYDRARRAWAKAGDVAHAAFATINVGEVLTDQGRLDEAEAMFREALRVWRAAGDDTGELYVVRNLARVAARSGRFEEALRLFEHAGRLAVRVGGTAELVETDARFAEYRVLRAEPVAALELTDRALRAAAQLGGLPTVAPSLHRVRGYALAQLGRVEEARAALEESLRIGQVRNADYEVAMTVLALARVRSMAGSPIDRGMEARAETIVERLGIVSVLDVPLTSAAQQRA